MDRVLGVIPARYASTRFPGKPLAPLGDGSLVEYVWRQARAARRIDRLVVATDDERIASVCRDRAGSRGTERPLRLSSVHQRIKRPPRSLTL